MSISKAKGLPTDIKTLVARQDDVIMVSETITNYLKGDFGSYEIPKKFLLLSEPFSLDNGMLTQTMKLKHNVVLDILMDRIEALYK